MGSDTASTPAALPSIAANMALSPSDCNSAACNSMSSNRGTPLTSRNAGLPTAIRRPPTSPTTPPPVKDSKSTTDSNCNPRSFAPPIMAAASGCSLFCSTDAAASSTSHSSKPPAAITLFRTGRPSVRVPVLSTTSVFTFSIISMASAFRISTPSCAPRPMPTMTDIGVARPSAHGQAIMSTDTALTTACARRGSGPTKNQTMKVSTATASTAGTKYPATLSASAWIGARLR